MFEQPAYPDYPRSKFRKDKRLNRELQFNVVEKTFRYVSPGLLYFSGCTESRVGQFGFLDSHYLR
jgi:hypothetical protein